MVIYYRSVYLIVLVVERIDGIDVYVEVAGFVFSFDFYFFFGGIGYGRGFIEFLVDR